MQCCERSTNVSLIFAMNTKSLNQREISSKNKALLVLIKCYLSVHSKCTDEKHKFFPFEYSEINVFDLKKELS